MLSHEDNETLVRVGPGTTMGGMMRLYWLPFMASKDLEKDGEVVELLPEFDANYRVIGNVGSRFWVVTDQGAPRKRVVSIERTPRR